MYHAKRRGSLTPSTLGCHLTQKWGCQTCLAKLRLFWSRVGTWSNMAGVLLRRNRNTRGEDGHVTKEADTGASTSQGGPRTASRHQKLGEARKDPSLHVSGEARPSCHPDLGRLPSTTVRQSICVVLSSRFVVICYSSRRKLTQWERWSPQPLPCRLRGVEQVTRRHWVNS